MSIVQSGSNNEIIVGKNVQLSGKVTGNNNRIIFAGAHQPSRVNVNVTGDNNLVVFVGMLVARGLEIAIGSHIPAHRTVLNVEKEFSIEPNGRFLLYTSGGALRIGRNCMFSSNVTVRCGESPHLLFDLETGAFLDQSKGVDIGDHVWIGENAYITKSASVGDECVVGACSVVTRRFDVKNAAIAGNPAKVVREGIQWHRNHGALRPGSKFKESHDEFHARFNSTL